MHVDFLLERFRRQPLTEALIWNGQSFAYGVLADRVEHWIAEIGRADLRPGSVVSIEGDFSPNGVSLFLALVERGCAVAPQSNQGAGREEKRAIGQFEHCFRIDPEDQVTSEATGVRADHPLYGVLRERAHPGLVLFSSGTSGQPKAAVHDFLNLLEKFKVKREPYVTVNFMLFDHWGGLNTLLHTLSNGGTVVTVRDRSPESVCRLIERHRISLLPATPTFLNLLLLSGCNRQFDLSSLRVISYGAEPMTESTLSRISQAFPDVKLQQTYGLIEVGVLRSKSRGDGSLWVKVGGEGYETRVVDDILQIKTASTILGYLNAPTPITEDGWFITGDAVIQDGEYLRILGRKSEMINVGGEKVFPAEVESVMLAMPNVRDVTVYGEKNAIMGTIVCAKVTPNEPVDAAEFVRALKVHCSGQLERFKVPVKIEVVTEAQHGDRFKKIRRV